MHFILVYLDLMNTYGIKKIDVIDYFKHKNRIRWLEDIKNLLLFDYSKG